MSNNPKRQLMISFVIIGVLILALGICGYQLYRLDNRSKPNPTPTGPEGGVFWKPMELKEAQDNISNFRTKYTLDAAKGVYYDVDTIRNYLDVVYPDLIKRIRLKTDYKWKIGFYFMRRPNPLGSLQLDCLVVPTQVQINNANSVLDFYDNPNEYLVSPKITVTDPPCSTCAGYDAGHLWP